MKRLGNHQKGKQLSVPHGSRFSEKPKNGYKISNRRNISQDEMQSATNTFHNASLAHERNAKEVLRSFEDYYESSSDEDNLNNEEIICKLTQSYKEQGDSQHKSLEKENLGNTAQYLTELCQSGAITCLICISRIKRQNEIWSCVKCYAIFHLKCIKQWVKDGVVKSTPLSNQHFPNLELPWYCPKCRMEYSKADSPKSYYCFCGQQKNPQFDPWLIPHSCGQLCNKLLQVSKCGHRCLLLCHPGPCPPCPQMVESGCHCGKEPPVSRRCGSRSWSCGKRCNKLLACKRHKCEEICHEGACKPCKQTSMQSCACGLHKQVRPCINPEWSCETPCGRVLACEYHRCEKKCHKPGQCGTCPNAGVRTCPCGKQVFEDLTCRDEVQLCGDTCGKILGCYGKHTCSRKCHFGECGPCPLITLKPCRCKRTKREVPCGKEFSCDSKCSRMRACGKHPCKQKCCVGNCSTCEQPCNKLLQCRKHKCQMRCHQGPCYPCSITSKISCNCGKTSITVPCGKEKKAKPPRCRHPCTAKTNCHHVTRITHPCHFGDCPECKQVCNKSLPCGHTCPQLCHDNVLIKNEIKPAAPWEKPQRQFEVKALPCPPCKVPVTLQCRGQHETGQFACCDAREYGCGRECGRLLRCSNHKCSRECHVVKNAKNDDLAGSNCEVCERPCEKPRAPGCDHKCQSPCHPGECTPCTKKIRFRCNCRLLQMEFLCSEWIAKTSEEQESAKSCGNPCSKVISPCDHACPLICHSGPCPSSEKCKKKVSQRCPCKRRKAEFICSKRYTQNFKVECDEKCMELKAVKEQERNEKERKKREEEEKRDRIEVERFERSMGLRPKQRKRRQSVDRPDSGGIWSRVGSKALFTCFVIGGVVVSFFAVWSFTKF